MYWFINNGNVDISFKTYPRKSVQNKISISITEFLLCRLSVTCMSLSSTKCSETQHKYVEVKKWNSPAWAAHMMLGWVQWEAMFIWMPSSITLNNGTMFHGQWFPWALLAYLTSFSCRESSAELSIAEDSHTRLKLRSIPHMSGHRIMGNITQGNKEPEAALVTVDWYTPGTL